MAVPTKTPAKTLTDKVWGQNVLDALPLKWRSALKYLTTKTPGVASGTDPDVIGVDGVIASQVLEGRTNEAEKSTTKLDGGVAQHVYHEQEYDEQFDLVVPTDSYLTTEGAELGDPRREIEGLIPGVDRVKTISPNTAVLDNFVMELPGTGTVDAPDFLESLQVITESAIGSGDSNETTLDAAVAGNFSFTIPVRATSQGSVAITKEIVPILVPIGGYRKNTRNFIFFLPTPVTIADVTARLQTLTSLPTVAWTNFRARPLTIIVTSKRVSLQVGASITYHASASAAPPGGSASTAKIVTGGTSVSREIVITTKTIRVPATVHGTLALATGQVNSSPLTVNALVQLVSPVGGTYTKQKNITNEVATVNVQAFGLAATPGATGLPTSGLLIVNTDGRPYKYGRAMLRVECIDASTL